MKELRNNFDTEIAFADLEEAKKYYMPDLEELPECAEYAQEIENTESLEELASVLNNHSDEFNGISWFVKEI